MLEDPQAIRTMRDPAHAPDRSRRRPRPQLLDALCQLAGGRGELVRHDERAWASITFSGARHRVVLTFAGAEAVAAGEHFIEALPEHEFAIAGQLVADAGIVSAVHETLPQLRLTVEAELLLLEDA